MTVARGGVEPPTFRFSVGRSYQLSYLAEGEPTRSVHRGQNHTGAREAHENGVGRSVPLCCAAFQAPIV